MLGKLFKHELKGVSRILLPLHIILLVCCVIGRFLLTPHLYNPDTPNFIITTSFSTFIFLITSSAIATSILISVRFYKSLFTDEGYLTWTLPATPGQHLLVKTITGTIWGIIDAICIVLALVILFYTKEFADLLPALGPEFEKVMGITLSQFGWFYIVIMLLSTPITVSMLYFCISVGQLFSSHRVLGAIITYLCLTVLTSVITTLVLLGSPYAVVILDRQSAIAAHMYDYLLFSIKMTVIVSVIEGSLSYLGAYYIMNKKINLI